MFGIHEYVDMSIFLYCHLDLWRNLQGTLCNNTTYTSHFGIIYIKTYVAHVMFNFPYPSGKSDISPTKHPFEQIIQSLLRLYLGCYPGKVCCQRFNQWWRQILLEMNLLVPIDKIWQDILCLEGEHFSCHCTYVVHKKNTQNIKTMSTLGCKWAKVWSTVIAGKRQTSFTSCARGDFFGVVSFVAQRSCPTFPTATHRGGFFNLKSAHVSQLHAMWNHAKGKFGNMYI